MNKEIRILSSVIDFLMVVLISIPFVIVEIIFIFNNNVNTLFYDVFVFTIISTAYLCKDKILNISYGKRHFKLIILDKNDSCQIKPYIYVIRNITYFIWPIELIFMIINKGQRIGDLIVGTKVVNTKDIKMIENKKISFFDKIKTLTIVFISQLILFYTIVYVLQNNSIFRLLWL